MITNTTVGCASKAPGLYTTNQAAQVRGDPDGNGCSDHHWVGTLPQGAHFKVDGICSGSDCFWCYGFAYGEVNQRASIICSELS